MPASKKRDPRGRKTNPQGRILSNGLYEHQWRQITKDASTRQIGGSVLLREIVDWYYTAKESAQGEYAQQLEFEKLPITKPITTQGE